MIPINMLQSMQARNREDIAYYEVDIKNNKMLRSYYDCTDNVVAEYVCHNRIQKAKKQLAVMVKLQKSLKAEIKAQCEVNSERNRLNRYYTSLHAHMDSGV